jgi:hypothetical protein
VGLKYEYSICYFEWSERCELFQAKTLETGEGTMYSVYIDIKDKAKFMEYYSFLGEKEAVEINGKKMSISYRFPFPNIE